MMDIAESIPRHFGGDGEIVGQKNLEAVVREVLDAMEGKSVGGSSARQQGAGLYEDAVAEEAAAVIHALERVRAAGTLHFDSCVVVGAAGVVVRSVYADPEELCAAVERSFGGELADVGFQCSDSPEAHGEMYRCIRSGGVLCELGLTKGGRSTAVDPYLAFCEKEMTVIGAGGGSPRDRKVAQAFLRRAREMGIPVDELDMIGRTVPEKQAVRKEET